MAGAQPRTTQPLEFLGSMAPMDPTVAATGLELEFPLGCQLNSGRRLVVLVRFNREAKRCGRRAHETTCRFSDDDGGDFEFAAPESVEESIDDAWIEICARSLGDHVASFEERHRLAVRSIAG